MLAVTLPGHPTAAVLLVPFADLGDQRFGKTLHVHPTGAHTRLGTIIGNRVLCPCSNRLLQEVDELLPGALGSVLSTAPAG
jgi:hypothetical protein